MKTPTLLIFIAVALLALSLSGCGARATKPRAEDIDTWSSPPSPRAALDSLVSMWNRRDDRRYADLFTGDYRFVWAPDSTNPGFQFGRIEELASTSAIFEATSTVLAARMGDWPEVADPRPGQDPTTHRAIGGALDLTIRIDEGTFRIHSQVKFYFLRGDSASGATSGASRWYIDRWEEIGPSTTHDLMPPSGGPLTLAKLKVLFLPALPAANHAPR